MRPNYDNPLDKKGDQMDIKAQRPNLLFTKLLFGLEPKSISMTCGSCDLEGIKELFSSPSFGFGRFCIWSWSV